jgi:hypothetical protein
MDSGLASASRRRPGMTKLLLIRIVLRVNRHGKFAMQPSHDLV